MPAQGSIEIDFGGGLGSNKASVAVTGQTAILATHSADAFIMAEASTEHTLNDQAYAKLFIAFSCTVPSAGVGFTIEARATEKLRGKFKVRWIWA